MISRTDDDLPPQRALRQLAGLHPVLYDAFEKAVESARSYFEAGNLPHDPYLFANLVRYHARMSLGFTSEVTGFTLFPLANSGIQLEYAGFVIRVWKADEGRLPAPGASITKAEFYYQPYLPDLLGAANPDAPVRLAVIWDLEANRSLSGLILVCPKGSENPWEPGEAHWQISIPHPAEAIEVRPELISAPADLEELSKPQLEEDEDAG